ncbi:hypothetical protein [Paenibacillus sp. S150]|uniref:CdiA C-terminal domain-containing protein n=1 Tax=Paenibacillus sp. S150 TaxID=2749826 RepID=UPI001C576B1B|nr:hypothetical protein [Paenibacillus sp. S150]MBW4084753.1 hypothetical protein [Paenibacillus sp. S150]
MGEKQYVDLSTLTQIQLTSIIADSSNSQDTKAAAMAEIMRRNFMLVENGMISAAKGASSAAKMLGKFLVKGGKTGTLLIEKGGSFSASEIRAAEYMKDLGKNVILRMPVGTRAAGETSDLLVNGINYDVYTPITNNVNRIIGSIASKNSQTSGIILDLSQTSVTADQLGDILARVRGGVKAGGKTPNITDIIILP